jgi:WS/DGAT/MGAT family acyltransferase
MPLDIERYKDTVRNTCCADRFHQRLAPSSFNLRRPFWEEDPDFDLDYHIQPVTLSEPADEAALQELIGMLMSEGLDLDRPLWRFYIVQNYQGGSALVCRLHHCLADGIALIRVLLSMASTSPDAPPAGLEAEEIGPLDLEQGWLDEILAQLPEGVKGPVRAARGLARAGLQILENPAYVLDGARLGANTAVAVGRLALRWPDPQTMFKGPLSGQKHAAWSAPLPLEEVKEVSRALGATINDVLLTAVAGSLRRYLEYREAAVDGLSIRGIVPVNLRPIEEISGLGNKFGLVFLSLPIGIADPVRRLRALKCSMDDIKDTPEAFAAYGILGFLGAVHPLLQEVAISIFDTKGTAVMTNVPGPRGRLYLAGAPINTVMAWVPQTGRVSLGVSVISYNCQVWVGIASDHDLVPDPERILAGFQDEFAELKARAGVVLEKRKAPTQPMLSRLEEALSALDDLLEENPADAEPPPVAVLLPAAACCQGQTRSGRPCKNPPLPGQEFCRVHIKSAVKAVEV